MENKLGEFVRKVRGDLSLRAFGEKCGVSHSHIDSIEKGYDFRTGKRVSITTDTLKKLSKGIGVEYLTLAALAENYDVPKISTDRTIESVPMNNLRKLRKEKELSLKQLGNYLGMSESTISLYENNKREPDIATLLRLADYFNVSVDYLLGHENKKESPLPIPMLGKDVQKLVDMYSSLDAENKDQVMRYVASIYYVDRANKSAQYTGALAAYEGGTQQHTVSKETAEEVLRRFDNLEKNT